MFGTMVPWRERLPRPFTRLEEQFERLFGPEDGWWKPTDGFTPAANVAETAEAYEVSLDLPGFKPDEINVEFNDGNLWVSGEHKEEKEEKGKTYHRVERRIGSFRRVIPLALNVDESKVEATYKDGVLLIVVPKTEEAKTKHIKIKT